MQSLHLLGYNETTSAMIVTTGSIIKVEACCGRFHFERSSEAPGCVYLHSAGKTVELPANEHELEMFISALRRAASEEVGYRKRECEL